MRLGVEGEVVTVTGAVQSIDVSPMAYDGPAEIRLLIDGNGVVVVYVQSCLGGCALEAVDQLHEVEQWETWQVTGEVQDDGSLLVYTDFEHSLLGLSER
jgi:hypothetical protein